MKQYTGTKTVQATPMTYAEALAKALTRENVDAEPDGYCVVYPDGYESWSPKSVFEQTYKPSDTVPDRIAIEEAQLVERTDKLSQFIYSSQHFPGLATSIRAMLTTQYHTMNAYLDLLRIRKKAIVGGEDLAMCNLSLEQALPLLREGYAIRRSGWNGKGLVVFKQVPARIEADAIPRMQSLPDQAKLILLKSGDHIEYRAQCLILNTNTGEANSWAPSISDLFAGDWELVCE